MSLSNKNRKIAISLRIREPILNWFRSRAPDGGYQTLLNAVLEEYVNNQIQLSNHLAGRGQELFRQYYAQCFWHYDKTLHIGPHNIQLVIDGLKKYGGREGFLIAKELCP